MGWIEEVLYNHEFIESMKEDSPEVWLEKAHEWEQTLSLKESLYMIVLMREFTENCLNKGEGINESKD
jgi:hypothetical protein